MNERRNSKPSELVFSRTLLIKACLQLQSERDAGYFRSLLVVLYERMPCC